MFAFRENICAFRMFAKFSHFAKIFCEIFAKKFAKCDRKFSHFFANVWFAGNPSFY